MALPLCFKDASPTSLVLILQTVWSYNKYLEDACQRLASYKVGDSQLGAVAELASVQRLLRETTGAFSFLLTEFPHCEEYFQGLRDTLSSQLEDETIPPGLKRLASLWTSPAQNPPQAHQDQNL